MRCHGYTQDRSVSGKVNSREDGAPTPGVNVLVKGTAVGTVTDKEGYFKLNPPTQNAILIFSFIGFKTQEVIIGNRAIIDVTLVNEATELL
jgi:hypothetical protein